MAAASLPHGKTQPAPQPAVVREQVQQQVQQQPTPALHPPGGSAGADGGVPPVQAARPPIAQAVLQPAQRQPVEPEVPVPQWQPGVAAPAAAEPPAPGDVRPPLAGAAAGLEPYDADADPPQLPEDVRALVAEVFGVAPTTVPVAEAYLWEQGLRSFR